MKFSDFYGIVTLIMNFAVNTKYHITILTLSFILSVFSFASILNFTDPYTAGNTIFLLFYLNLFLLSFAGICLLSLWLKRWLGPKIFILDFSSSVRHGLLLGTFITLAVLLQMHGILFWWLEITMLIFLIFLELFFTLK